MPIVQTNTGLAFPNLLALASRVRREVTKETLTSLVDDAVNNVIVDSINDAIADIYNRDRWWWQKTAGTITPVAGTSAYALPADFYRMASPIVIGSTELKEVEAEQWVRYTFTPTLATTGSGTPAIYCVDMAQVKFYPTPSAGFITQFSTITLPYIKGPSARLVLATDSALAPNLPNEFIEAVVRYAMSRLKVFLQYDDYLIDEKRYEYLIQKQIENNYKGVFPARMRPRNWRSANFG